MCESGKSLLQGTEPWEVSHKSPTRLNSNIEASHACLFRTYWMLQTCWRSNRENERQKAGWRMKFWRQKSFNSIPLRLSTLDKPQTDFIISNHSKMKNFTETSPSAETEGAVWSQLATLLLCCPHSCQISAETRFTGVSLVYRTRPGSDIVPIALHVEQWN